jgi:hypothetical protein
VRADGGVATVTYLPQDSRYAEFIPEVLVPVEGIAEVRSTMAETNILWIQERFDSDSEAFGEVVELATKWNAAVELLSLAPREAGQAGSAAEPATAEPDAAAQYNGGIEDDVEEAAPDGNGAKSTLNELAAVGRSGGGAVVHGGTQDLLESLDRSRPYSLVVLGDLFLDKGHAARVRMTRELQRFVGEHITAPVVGTDELKAQYLFGRRDVARLVGFLAVVAVLYLLVFSNQEIILRFLSGQLLGASILAKLAVALAVFVFVPIIAHCYGSIAKSLMKLIKME